jgi:exodeoxyribonuclease VII large subunit
MAIFDSKIPVISAVGHEVDFSISDFVADKRAATPTAAAEIATPNVIDIKSQIADTKSYLLKNMNRIFNEKETSLVHIVNRLDAQNPIIKLKNTSEKISLLNKNLENLFAKYIDNAKSKLDLYTSLLNPKFKQIYENKLNRFSLNTEKLKALNPLAIMDKGFSVAINNGNVVKSINDVKTNDNIDLKLKDGIINAKVMGVKENGR